MESDSDETENICPICFKSFPTIAGVRVHWRHHSAKEIQAAINNKAQAQHSTNDCVDAQQSPTITASRYQNSIQIIRNDSTSGRIFQQFNIIENSEAGDCLFLAVLEFLKNPTNNFNNVPKDAIELRQLTVNYILSLSSEGIHLNFARFRDSIIINLQNHIPGFENGIEDSNSDEAIRNVYFNYMSSQGIDGTATELSAMSEIFGFVAYLIQNTSPTEFSSYDYGCEYSDGVKTLYLLFTGNTNSGHFRSLTPTNESSRSDIPPGTYRVVSDHTSSKLMSITPLSEFIEPVVEELIDHQSTATTTSQSMSTTDTGKPSGDFSSDENELRDQPSSPATNLRPDNLVESQLGNSPGVSILCHLCPADKAKNYKGTKGFKLHCNSAHPEHQIQNVHLDPPLTAAITSEVITNDQLLENMKILKSNVKVLKRIPKAGRLYSSQDFTKALEDTIKDINSFESWFRLLSFPFVAFRAPDRKDKATSKLSLATCVKRNLKFWNEVKHLPFREFFEKITPTKVKQHRKKTKLDTDEARIKKVQSKLNDGDVKGAIRILSSDESVAPINRETYLKLLEKHPAPELQVEFDDSSIPSIDWVTESEVKVAISKFENGSAGGLDGLRPQHLKDMISVEIGDHGILMLTRLSTFSDSLLNGKAPDFIIPILYGASLCALNKKDFTIRPIAVGSTFRRLVSKIACARVADKLGSYLKPKQLGFATKGGAEAGAHAARAFINANHTSPTVFIKLDYSNAFNDLERDPMLLSAYQHCPEIYPFLKQCYSTPTKLVFGEYTILSQRGCQQGDPCGPPLFCLIIQEMVNTLNSDLNIWYLDDGSLGGSPDVVLNDLKLIMQRSSSLGLHLNFSKCELMVLGVDNIQEVNRIFESLNAVAPGIKLKDSEIELLGAPLTDCGIPAAILSKKSALERMVDRLRKLNSHQSFYLLRHSFSIPRLTYLLRTTPCWRAMDSLNEYNQLLRTSLERVINCELDSSAWIECSLSVKCGGLGLRIVTNLCFSSFLGSYHFVSELVQQILPSYIQPSTDLLEEALGSWQSITAKEPLESPLCKYQHQWDETMCNVIHQQCLKNNSSEVGRARILANVAQDSSSWLNALPCSSLGTLLDSQSFRIAACLRLGLPVCHPHTCVCGKEVDKFGRHGLACKYSYGRKAKHETVNDLLKRALVTCGFPALREPTGCNRSDGKKPDGLTLIPWKCGKPLIWDFTSADTTCQSYVALTSRRAGAAANSIRSFT